MTSPRPKQPELTASSATLTVAATVSPSPVAPGATATLAVTLTPTEAVTPIIHVEFGTAAGSCVYMHQVRDQSFAAGQAKTVTIPWTVPSQMPPGTYDVLVGVISQDGTIGYFWSGQMTLFVVAGAPRVSPPVPTTPQKLFGATIEGAGGWVEPPSLLPGQYGVNYTFALEPARMAYLMGLGLTLMRLPFRWERLQSSALTALRPVDVLGLRGQLDAVAAVGGRAILSMENWGRYFGAPLARADAAKFADVWSRIAQAFKGHPALWGYEIMWQPYGLPEGQPGWNDVAQAAVNAIRVHDTSSYVLIDGYESARAHYWATVNPTLQVNDSAGRLAYAAYMVFDADFSGSYASFNVAPTVGVDRLQGYLNWLSARGAKGFISGYGVPDTDPRWLDVLDRFLAAVDASPLLLGGTYWAAGAWSVGSKLSIEPGYGPHLPQVATLRRHPSR